MSLGGDAPDSFHLSDLLIFAPVLFALIAVGYYAVRLVIALHRWQPKVAVMIVAAIPVLLAICVRFALLPTGPLLYLFSFTPVIVVLFNVSCAWEFHSRWNTGEGGLYLPAAILFALAAVAMLVVSFQIGTLRWH